MKSVTLAVIFAGLISYGTIYTSSAIPSHESTSYSTLALEDPPLNSEPDDEEDHDRVNPPRRKTK